MKLTDRYALREILAPTVVAFAIYTGFMLIRGLVQFSDLLLQSSRPAPGHRSRPRVLDARTSSS